MPGNLKVPRNKPQKLGKTHATWGLGSVPGCDHTTVYLFSLDEDRAYRFHCRLGDPS
jgi:hypothetical protein